MAFTDHMREVAYEMFGNGETSAAVARRTRQPLTSVRALRANYTRQQTAAAEARKTKRQTRTLKTVSASR